VRECTRSFSRPTATVRNVMQGWANPQPTTSHQSSDSSEQLHCLPPVALALHRMRVAAQQQQPTLIWNVDKPRLSSSAQENHPMSSPRITVGIFAIFSIMLIVMRVLIERGGGSSFLRNAAFMTFIVSAVPLSLLLAFKIRLRCARR